jgi:hypothetical protein
VTKVWGWDLEKLNEDGKKDAAANVEKEIFSSPPISTSRRSM